VGWPLVTYTANMWGGYEVCQEENTAVTEVSLQEYKSKVLFFVKIHEK